MEFEGTPRAGTYRGLKEMEAHFREGGRTGWDEGGCFPEKFSVNGDKIVAHVHVRVRIRKTGEWVEGRVADAFGFRGGKVIEWRTFSEAKDALAWAGA